MTSDRPAVPVLAQLLVAFICLSGALGLLALAGLPERVEFTRYALPDGSYAAAEIGAPAPPFTTLTASGQPFALADLRGQTVLLNFWATWCEPCKAEMPELEALSRAEQNQGLKIIGVNLGESPAQIQAWVNTYDLTFEQVIDPNGAIAALYFLRGQPSTYLIDENGIIRQIIYGATAQSTLQSALDSIRTSASGPTETE